MLAFTHPILDALFLLSVAIIWIMIGYQLILTFAGYRFRRRIQSEQPVLQQQISEWPAVSVMVPARNEARVIRQTLERITGLDYPKELIQVVIINDGSNDETSTIVNAYSMNDPRVRCIDLPRGETGHGKAYALNVGLQHCRHELIAIYDADNRPEKNSLKVLVPHLRDPQAAAAIGKFRTVNKNRNWLTRFINIETLAFQWILQAGRFQLARVAILPGTNYVIKKNVLQELGGWDEKAITEDSELSIRIYQSGYFIKFVPLSTTWEQEPEKLAVWIRQRTRWVRGNNYVLKKFFRSTQVLSNKYLLMEFLYLFALYYLFLLAMVLSLSLFFLSATGLIAITVPGPYWGVWISAFVLFILEITVVLSYEDEDSWKNILLSILMYFTYCQLWLYVVFKSLYLDLRKKRVGIWDKTERFDVTEEGMTS